VLKNCLVNKIPAGTTIKGVNIIHSADSPLAQLARHPYWGGGGKLVWFEGR